MSALNIAPNGQPMDFESMVTMMCDMHKTLTSNALIISDGNDNAEALILFPAAMKKVYKLFDGLHGRNEAKADALLDAIQDAAVHMDVLVAGMRNESIKVLERAL